MPPSKIYTWISGIFDVSKYILLLAIIVAVFFVFVGVPLLVSGESMLPTLQSGNVVLVEQVSYRGTNPINRGDIVAARFPADSAKVRLIKRVIGLPGERIHVQGGQVYINDHLLIEPYTTPGSSPFDSDKDTLLRDDQYFLIGDNRPGSGDSRLWGPVFRQDIQGKVSMQLWPIGQLHFTEMPQYQLAE